MGAFLHDAPGVEHDDPVGARGLREAVRDDQGRAALQDGVRGAFQRAGAGAARFRRGLVEHGDLRVLQVQAGERELLRLRGRELHAAEADHGVQARPVRTDGVEGLLERRVGRVGPGEPEIVRERAREHVHLLRHERDVAELCLARRGFVEARDDLGQRRLAGAGHADDRHPLAGLDVQVDVVQDGRAAVVGVADLAQ